MRVILDSDEVAIAKEVSKNWGTQTWGDCGYNGGLLNSESDPRRTERIGIYGQIAFGKLMNRPVDLAYRADGDAYDDYFRERSIDVKTAKQHCSRGLVTAAKSKHRAMRHKDIYVFSFLEFESDPQVYIQFAGALALKDFSVNWLKVSPYGHLNWSVPYGSLNPIPKLIEYWQGSPECGKVSYEINR